jgi:hypothetical protein
LLTDGPDAQDDEASGGGTQSGERLVRHAGERDVGESRK